jgi:hypothetical protein
MCGFREGRLRKTSEPSLMPPVSDEMQFFIHAYAALKEECPSLLIPVGGDDSHFYYADGALDVQMAIDLVGTWVRDTIGADTTNAQIPNGIFELLNRAAAFTKPKYSQEILREFGENLATHPNALERFRLDARLSARSRDMLDEMLQ